MKKYTQQNWKIRHLVETIAQSFDVGVVFLDQAETPWYEVNRGCGSCSFCSVIMDNFEKSIHCYKTHLHGLQQSFRFGGKYVYLCPSGLTCFSSPILMDDEIQGGIVVGPFLMVEAADYIDYDLTVRFSLTESRKKLAHKIIEDLPYISPDKVNYLTGILFMSVGFLNQVESYRLEQTQASDLVQGQISDYIMHLKGQNYAMLEYPFQKEKDLIACIMASNKSKAQMQLNELLGFIFFSLGGDLEKVKSRVYELLVLISRAAIELGADPAQTLQQNHQNMAQIINLKTVEALCFWLTEVINGYMDSLFELGHIKHVTVFQKALQYIRTNYTRKITLEEVATEVYLSSSYLSKLFVQELNCTFSAYLNRLRVKASLQLLLNQDLSTADIAGLVGFESQSYFNRVFKKQMDLTPGQYRIGRGKI